MDFFAHQDRARASTRRLVLLYILALAAAVVSLNIVAALIWGYGATAGRDDVGAFSWEAVTSNAGLYAITTVGSLVIIGVATLFKHLQLGGDGAKVAELLGGRPVTGATSDLDERKLMNVVEEMSLASGVPVPRVYIMDREEGINAFAAGLRSEAAVIGVTRGAIRSLSRDELQGVIAHEFSHILNGDMRLNLRMIALNFGIMAIGYIGLQVLRYMPSTSRRSSSNRKDGGGGGVMAILLIGVAMVVIGYIGTLFAKMLQAAVSRQREYLADASAVQFTRNPRGISGALKKIGGLGSRLASPHAGEASHMFFGEGVGGFLDSVFATHPPLEKRIRAIEPDFDGKMLGSGAPTHTPSHASPAAAMGLAGGAVSLPSAGERVAADPRQITQARTAVDRQQLSFGAATLEGLSQQLHDAASDPYTARGVALALLLDHNASIRELQLELLAASDESLARIAAACWQHIAAAGPAARLPVLDLALPALLHLSLPQRAEFRRLVLACAEADQQISPFELALFKIIEQQLPVGPTQRRPGRFRTVQSAAEPIAMVLSVLANAGGGQQADAAFAAGARQLGLPAIPDRSPAYDPAAFAQALTALADAPRDVRLRIVDAAAHCVVADGSVRIEEMELMRAVSAALGVAVAPSLTPST